MADNIPLDLKLLRQIVREASYGGIKFWVAQCQVHTGRNVNLQQFRKFKVRSTTNVAGAQGPEGANELAVENLRNNPDAAANVAEYDAQVAARKVDASTGKVKPGELPKPEDKGMQPQKITCRAFFIDFEDKGRVTLSPGILSPTGLQAISDKNIVRTSYTVNRDLFIEATNDKEPKKLQLPTYGEFLAIPGQVTTSYDYENGGIEYMDVEFYRAVEDVSFERPTGGKTVALADAESTYAAVAANVSDKRDGVITALTSPTGGLKTRTQEDMEAIDRAYLERAGYGSRNIISSTIRTIEQNVGSIDKYILEVTKISNTLTTLILTPSRLCDSIIRSYRMLSSAITNPVEAYEYMVGRLSTFIDELSDTTYETLDALGLYEASTGVLHATASYTAAMEAIASTEYSNSDEVEEVRDEITARHRELIDILSRFPEYEEVLGTIHDLYGSTISYLMDVQAQLPRIREIQTMDNVPLIVTAHRLYGDVYMGDALALRNSVQSRLFPPTTLEVLST